MKNKLFLFLIISILFFVPKDVFALEQVPYTSKINGTLFTDLFKPVGNNITVSIPANGTRSIPIITTTLYSNVQQNFVEYPYVVIYFTSWFTIDEFYVERTGSCNQSCYSSNVQVVQIGNASSNNRRLYALVLKVSKYYTYEWVGDYTTIPDEVADNITFGNRYSSAVDVVFTDIVLADSNSILNNDYQNYQKMISNATQNTQSIINSQNNNTQSIINNQNQNWNNFNNTDLSNSDKQAPDTQDYSSYQQAEQNLFGQMTNADISNVNIAIDSNSATWVWGRITEWLGTNALLMSFLVSMLSIGIIKMALGR